MCIRDSIGRALKREDVYQNFKDKWLSLYYWFVGQDGYNEVDHLYDISNEIIRKMTRYAQQISEMINRGSHRKEQYIHLSLIHIFLLRPNQYQHIMF